MKPNTIHKIVHIRLRAIGEVLQSRLHRRNHLSGLLGDNVVNAGSVSEAALCLKDAKHVAVDQRVTSRRVFGLRQETSVVDGDESTRLCLGVDTNL
jgi:hypothetical protein